MKIAFFLLNDEQKERFKEKFKDHEVKLYSEPLSLDNIEEIGDFEILVSRPNGMDLKFDKETLEKFPNLKFVSAMSTGFDHIDLDYCKEKNVKVSNVPSYSEESVAEHVFALLLVISRKIIESSGSLKGDEIDLSDLEGFELKDRTLGVIGSGKIGLNIIKIARVFGMKVIVYDIVHNDEAKKELGFEYVELDDLMKDSDIISLHAPYNKHTHHLLNKERIGLMKENVVLINTARGELIDSKDLMDFLKKNGKSFAGLDVYEEEYLKELLELENVILTPHNAANTIEARKRMTDETIENISEFLDGKIKNEVKG